MKNVISYVRVSTARQGEYGFSLNVQTQQIEEFSRANELVIRKRFKDVGSARNEEGGSEREEFNKAIELSLEKQWPIIVATADRFTRTTPVFDDFVRSGGQLIVANEGLGIEEDVLRARIVGAKAAGDFIARRTRIGQKEAVRNGKKLGNPNIAEAQKKALAVRARDAQIRLDEFSGFYASERARGSKSDQAIAQAFNKRSYVTASGKRWTFENVRRMRAAMEAKSAGAAPGRAKGEIGRGGPASDQGHSPAFGEPPVERHAPGIPVGDLLKYPDPGHPEGALVDYDGRLTPHTYARCMHLLERDSPHVVGKFSKLKERRIHAGDLRRIQEFLDRRRPENRINIEELEAILGDLDLAPERGAAPTTASETEPAQENVRSGARGEDEAPAMAPGGANDGELAEMRPAPPQDGPRPSAEPSVSAEMPEPRNERALKYPYAAAPEGNIVDERGFLTPQALARLGYLAEKKGKDADAFVRPFRTRRARTTEQKKAVADFFEQQWKKELEAALADFEL